MFYAMRISVSISENTTKKIYWVFENKADRDHCVQCNPTFHSTAKPPKNESMKVFSHFRETWSGLFLIPVEK